MRLLPKDFVRLQRAILALHECRTVAALKQALPAILLSLIPADCFYLADFDGLPEVERVKIVALGTPGQQIKPLPVHSGAGAALPHFTWKTIGPIRDHGVQKFAGGFTTTRRQGVAAFCKQMDQALGIRRKITVPVTAHSLGIIGWRNDGKYFIGHDRWMLDAIRPHLDQARRRAERLADARPAPVPPLMAYGLTPREVEISGWLTVGKTNAEIAVILSASVRTVEKHLEFILKKLGVENRTAAATLMAAAGAGQPAAILPGPSGGLQNVSG